MCPCRISVVVARSVYVTGAKKNKAKKGTRRKRELVKANVVGAILSTLSLNIHGEAIAFTLPAAVLSYCNKFLFCSAALSLSLSFGPLSLNGTAGECCMTEKKKVYKRATCGKVGRNKSLSLFLSCRKTLFLECCIVTVALPLTAVYRIHHFFIFYFKRIAIINDDHQSYFKHSVAECF